MNPYENMAPLARIILRYGVGYVLGNSDIAFELQANPDVVAMVAVAIGALVESAYAWAKKRGGKT